MSAESFKRKLTAILSADVKGYSRLMGEDEAETVKTLTAYRKIMGELIQQHRGRVIDSPGDNILAGFARHGRYFGSCRMERLGPYRSSHQLQIHRLISGA